MFRLVKEKLRHSPATGAPGQTTGFALPGAITATLALPQFRVGIGVGQVAERADARQGFPRRASND